MRHAWRVNESAKRWIPHLQVPMRRERAMPLQVQAELPQSVLALEHAACSRRLDHRPLTKPSTCRRTRFFYRAHPCGLRNGHSQGVPMRFGVQAQEELHVLLGVPAVPVGGSG